MNTYLQCYFNCSEHFTWASLIAQLVRISLQCRRLWFDSRVWKIPWRRDRLPTPVFLGFPCGLAGKEPACNARDLGSIPRLGRSPGKRNSYPLQYSGLENSMDRGVWQATVHGVAKSQTQLSLLPVSLVKHSLSPVCLTCRWLLCAQPHGERLRHHKGN